MDHRNETDDLHHDQVEGVNQVVDDKFRNSLALLVLLIFFTIFFGQALKPDQIFFYLDHGFQNIPFRFFAFNSFNSGTVPLWCPYSAGGFPFFAEGQSGAAYPVNWLFYKSFPFSLAYNFSLISHLFLFACGCFYLFRRFGYSELASLIAALTISFSGYFIRKLMFVNFIQGFAWIPLILLALPTGNTKFSLRRLVPLSASVGMLCLAGHPQAIFIGLTCAVLFFIFNPLNVHKMGSKRLISRCCWFVLAIILGLIIGTRQLLPTTELTLQTNRVDSQSSQLSGQMSLPPASLPTLFLNHPFGSANDGTFDLDDWSAYEWELSIFIGMSAFFLALLSGVSSSRTRFFWGCILTGILLSLGKFTLLQEVIGRLPLVNSFRAPVRWSILFIWGFAGLEAHAIDQIKEAVCHKNTKTRRFAGVIILVIVVLTALLFVSVGSGIKTIQPEFKHAFTGAFIILILMGCLIVLSVVLRRCEVLFLLPILVFGELYWANHDYPVVGKPQIITGQPAGLDSISENGRILSLIQEKMPGVSMDWHSGWSLPDKGDYLLLKDSYPMYSGMILERDVLTFNEWSPLHFSSYRKWAQLLGHRANRTITNFNLKYVVAPENNPLFLGKSIFSDDAWEIRKLELPVSDVAIQSSGCKQDLKYVSEARLEDLISFSEVLIENKDMGEDGLLCHDRRSLSLNRPNINTRTFSIEAQEPALILLSEIFDSGWNASEQTTATEFEMFRYDSLFLGLKIPAGKHEIKIKYEPISYRLGLFLSLVGMLFGLAFLQQARIVTNEAVYLSHYSENQCSRVFVGYSIVCVLVLISGWVAYSEEWYEGMLNWII